MKQLSIDQLQYIAKQQIARASLIFFCSRVDKPERGDRSTRNRYTSMAVINLRVVQLIAMTTGLKSIPRMK